MYKLVIIFIISLTFCSLGAEDETTEKKLAELEEAIAEQTVIVKREQAKLAILKAAQFQLYNTRVDEWMEACSFHGEMPKVSVGKRIFYKRAWGHIEAYNKAADSSMRRYHLDKLVFLIANRRVDSKHIVLQVKSGSDESWNTILKIYRNSKGMAIRNRNDLRQPVGLR